MNNEPGRITVILAHPNIEESKANKELIDSVKEQDYVLVYNLYEERVSQMSAETWSELLFESSAIVFQFPLYWLSAPYPLKKWLDEIFIGLAKTPVVMGKPLQIVTTTGSDYDSYRSGGQNAFTIDELLRPYQVTALHSGMIWQTPLVIFGTGSEDPGRAIAEGAIKYKTLLESLANNAKISIGLQW